MKLTVHWKKIHVCEKILLECWEAHEYIFFLLVAMKQKTATFISHVVAKRNGFWLKHSLLQ